MTEDAFKEAVYKPHRGSGSVMDERATLELNFPDSVVEVDRNSSYGGLGLILLIVEVKYHHCCHICSININFSLGFDTSDDDTIHIVVIVIREARK